MHRPPGESSAPAGNLDALDAGLGERVGGGRGALLPSSVATVRPRPLAARRIECCFPQSDRLASGDGSRPHRAGHRAWWPHADGAGAGRPRDRRAIPTVISWLGREVQDKAGPDSWNQGPVPGCESPVRRVSPGWMERV